MEKKQQTTVELTAARARKHYRKRLPISVTLSLPLTVSVVVFTVSVFFTVNHCMIRSVTNLSIKPVCFVKQTRSDCTSPSRQLFSTIIVIKVGFQYPSSRPEFTGRYDGQRTRVHFLTPVNSGRHLG